ncbi:uncharacterized protein MONOS_14307 [Monocercomonoides exilis]|uniref:uncharacterized protein n=1 Tax=Monocercomonoides exilis TaxID=2049356 RepID=UPI0035598C84|nr:hypothetical protein MONOS_14307 [Monocercomonoides exilis]|eukprot:MONOS_14307.1-p1 / transcript=MONOS_14307.1 / gene=MONOS_14307 / organism=Monocercomonoides_exilis_PA203 / gene_product=unspecified product / transcript_product=unspecified product / location=Mono_scaffold00977:6044-7225(+) / protein_length=284 / sequence_SO=supercontig / SO=protein_coding / is_pseudo=false
MTEDEKSSSSSSSSSAPTIDPSDDSMVEASFITSTTTMDNIESRLRIVELEECEVCANQKKSLPCALHTLRGYIVSAIARLVSRSQQSRHVVVKLDDEVMVRGVAGHEVVEIVEKGSWMVGMRMEDVVLPPAAIVLNLLEERKEEEVGKGKGCEAGERAGRAAAGEGQDHLDESEEDSAAEREAQRRGEAGEGEEVLGSARRSGEYGCQVKTGWSGVTIDTSSSLIYLNGKGIVAKVGSGVSVARKTNSFGGGGGGRADATVQQKMNKMEKETKMLIALSKVQ